MLAHQDFSSLITESTIFYKIHIVNECIDSICRVIFFPVWTFHAVVARGRFSLPAPSAPHNRHVSIFLLMIIKVLIYPVNLNFFSIIAIELFSYFEMPSLNL